MEEDLSNSFSNQIPFDPFPRIHQQDGTTSENQGDDDGLDRISALPDILCQHIVSFLPATDARRTTFLSKRWRYLFFASPSFTFDECEFHKRPPPSLRRFRSRQNFIRFVDETMEFRNTLFNDLIVDKFKISMRFVEEITPCLNKWVAFALDKNVKELSVIAEMKDLIAIAEFFHPFRIPYQIPQPVFSAISIQSLELVFCDLTHVCASAVNLPYLKNLDLINVRINDSLLESILLGSPLLEKINLSLVCGLERIEIPGEKLKMLVVFKCMPLQQVIVKAPNIESLLYRGKRQHHDKIDISACQKLKFLWIQRASNLTDESLEKVAKKNQDLEVMILIHCSGLRKPIIQSPNLWMFVLFKCRHLSRAKIEAPKLHAFEYSGHMINFTSVVSSSELNAIIHMDGQEVSTRWYSKLKEMCASFDHCRTLFIRCEQDMDLIVPRELRRRLLPQLHGLSELKIHVRNGTMNVSKLEDGIRWIYPGLKNLYVESNGSTHHFQYAGSIGEIGTDWGKCRDFMRTRII